MTNLLSRTILMSTPLLLGSLAEVFAERTGVMICAIEGIFLIGAWGGFVGAWFTSSALAGFLLASFCGLVMACLYGFITIKLGQHQVVTGAALNILAAGFCSFFQRVIFGVPLYPLVIKTLPSLKIPLLSNIPVIGTVFFSQNIVTYLAYLLVPVVWFVLYRTSPGLQMRSAGENPSALETAGKSVISLRFFTVMCAGAVGGIAGAFYTVGYVGMFTSGIIGGRGWIAFAICFLGNWQPLGALVGTLAFGLADALSVYIQSVNVSSVFPRELVIALPYILTIVLTVMRKDLKVPAYLGTAYRKES